MALSFTIGDLEAATAQARLARGLASTSTPTPQLALSFPLFGLVS